MRHPLRLVGLLLLVLGLLAPLTVRADEDEPGTEPPPVVPAEPPPVIPAGPEPGMEDAETPATEVEAPWRRREVKELDASPTGVQAPPGMIYVPAGRAVIGTPGEDVEKLLTGRPPTVRSKFAFERPQHEVSMPGYFFGKYEVSNAQYYAFLRDAHAKTHVTTGALANLDEVAAHLLHMPLEEVSGKRAPYTRILYDANKALLWEKMPQLLVKQGEAVSEEGTYRKFRRAPLPRDLELQFYDLVPPLDWRDVAPPEDLLDVPVRNISYVDFATFAEWAGMHVPTEFEWEYAARGPEGYLWPWGDRWFPDTSRANWGSKIVDARFRPRPVAVDGVPAAHVRGASATVPPYDGMSWCGAWHMIGNVWEWTSSWFAAYPGNATRHGWMGDYVKVLRGASFEDVDTLALRSAVRNWEGIGAKGPPRVENRFDNVGGRLAWSGNPGQDQLEPVIARAVHARRVKRDRLALDRWVGAATWKFAPDPAAVEHHVYIQGAAKALILIPLRSVLREDDEKTKLRKRNDLLKASVAAEDPFPLAVLHTQLPLAGVHVLDREEARKQAAAGSGRRRRKPKAPPTQSGEIRPETYLLAFWHERLCLTLPSLDFVCFLSKGKIPPEQLDITKLEEALPETSLEVTAVADMIEIALAIPIGGAKNEPHHTLLIQKVTIEFQEGALDSAGAWQAGRAGFVPAAPGAPPQAPGEDAPEEAPTPEAHPEESSPEE